MNTGEKTVGAIPAIGFGTWTGDDIADCVAWALEAGYRHIDTAQGYKNEAACGGAIHRSGITRDEIFITTKVAPDNYGPGALRPSVEKSLDRLRVDQVDLLLLHWPSPHNKYPMPSYMEQFAEVFDAGLARMIGVSNFTIPLIAQAIALLGDRPISTNQVEIHVFMQNRPIVDHCRSIGIPTTAYAPLARGAVAGDPVLAEIGAAHGATEGQIALAFLLAEGHAVIPSSRKKDRIAANRAAGKITLSEDEVRRLRTLDRGQRIVNSAGRPVWD